MNGALSLDMMTEEEKEMMDRFLSKPITVREAVKFKSCDMSPEYAQTLVNKISYWVSQFFGRSWDLELLEEVLISPNYHAALAQVDLGYSRQQPLSATRDAMVEGVAMAVPVLRDGKLVMQLILNANIIAALLDEEHEQFVLARSIIAHECAHIHDLAEKQKAFPNELLEFETLKRFGTTDFTFQQIAFACWGEYAACRLSVNWMPENETEILEDNLRPTLEGIEERIKKYHREYLEHGPLITLFNSVFVDLGNLAKYVSYLLGHLDGREQEFETASPKIFALIQETPFFLPLFNELRTIFHTMWSSYGEWASYESFDALEQFAKNLLVEGGVLPEDTPDGLYIHVSTVD
jgi:hypothetical protein